MGQRGRGAEGQRDRGAEVLGLGAEGQRVKGAEGMGGRGMWADRGGGGDSGLEKGRSPTGDEDLRDISRDRSRKDRVGLSLGNEFNRQLLRILTEQQGLEITTHCRCG